jgi:hypothetical protein
MLPVMKYELCNDESLRKCFVWTVAGYHWDRGATGGIAEYLGNADKELLQRSIIEAADGLNCMTVHGTLKIAWDIRQNRAFHAMACLHALKLPGCVRHLNQVYGLKEPSRQWLARTCEGLNIKICTPQTLELARRSYCDKPGIEAFLTNSATCWTETRG